MNSEEHKCGVTDGHGSFQKVNRVRQGTPPRSLNDSLEGDLRAFLIDQDQLHTYDDLTKVNPVTPTTVLECLQARYRGQVFYTQAGCTLVALNPFQPIPALYSLDVMKEYHSAPQPQESRPHIFTVAEEAYRNVQGHLEPVDQSLVVSGESGAGKTWTSRCLMRYYATVAALSSVLKGQDAVDRIERRVLDSNPIMEAFGNACTLRNHNSSRFGKYIQLQLNRSHLLVGASVQTYLLEKTRVACQPAGERNFHIFYQMMKGASSEQKKEWKMSPGQSFNWLPKASKTLEEDCFQETVEAMSHLGIKSEKQAEIFRVLAGILQLGNITFDAPLKESEPCALEGQSKEALQRAAALLGVPGEELQACLAVRTLVAGKQSILKPCSRSECGVRRDCLAKVVYARLFEWLTVFINNSICADHSSWCNFIGLLDVYGFECFQKNSLEQLCINYANEKLQQHFVGHYLRAQQEEYVSEGLEWSFVRYQDNQSCLDLIEGNPTGIFTLLNEECRLNRPPDAGAFCERLQKELGDRGSMSWDQFSQEPHFTVSHYAGPVCYQAQGMMEKNKDPVPPEILALLKGSGVPLLVQVFGDQEPEDPATRGLSKMVTVVAKFRNSLGSLMQILHSTTPHYTRCIKPNPDCQPLTFHKREVLMQLEACGIVETIHISAAGFPIRIPFGGFVQRYGLISTSSQIKQLVHSKERGPGHGDLLRTAVDAIVSEALGGWSAGPDLHNDRESCPPLVHCGRTKVFITQDTMELLEAQRKRVLAREAFSIQCCWRRHRLHRRHARVRAAVRIQAGVRSWLVRRTVCRWQRAAVVIQTTWREWRASMGVLAEAELDDAGDFEGTQRPDLHPAVWQSGAVLLPSLPGPVPLRGWPLGLALAAAPSSASVSLWNLLEARGFQKMVSMLACLDLPFSSREYQVETNQYQHGVTSIRALPPGSVKLHYQRSPLLYADVPPHLRRGGVTGFNQILLEKTL